MQQIVLRVIGIESIRRTASVLIAGVWLSTAGCHGCDTTWSVKVGSPDGKVVATARTVACSGFGTGMIVTDVFLNWSGDRRPAQEVMGFSDEYEAPEKTMVGLQWLTPTHLEVTYRGPRDVTFQAIKWATVEISLRDLAAEPSSVARSACCVSGRLDHQAPHSHDDAVATLRPVPGGAQSHSRPGLARRATTDALSINDSSASVSLAIDALRADDRDSPAAYIVTRFERDSAGIVVELIPDTPERSTGRGGRVRVTRRGVVQILQRYQ